MPNSAARRPTLSGPRCGSQGGAAPQALGLATSVTITQIDIGPTNGRKTAGGAATRVRHSGQMPLVRVQPDDLDQVAARRRHPATPRGGSTTRRRCRLARRSWRRTTALRLGPGAGRALPLHPRRRRRAGGDAGRSTCRRGTTCICSGCGSWSIPTTAGGATAGDHERGAADGRAGRTHDRGSRRSKTTWGAEVRRAVRLRLRQPRRPAAPAAGRRRPGRRCDRLWAEAEAAAADYRLERLLPPVAGRDAAAR